MLPYFPKNQPNIQRNIEKQCMICFKQFKFGRSEHQCKRCLRAVCKECGSEKIQLYKLGFSVNPHRGCKICVEQIKGVKEYIRQNQIGFGKMSLVGEKWVKKVEKNVAYLPGQSKKASQFKKQVFSRMWDSYHYSMRQFVGLLTFEISQEQVYMAVLFVVKSVLGVYPKADLESVAYVAMFMLCFCPTDKAVLLCLYLIELKDLISSSGGMITAYLKALGLSSNQKLRDFIKYIGSRYTASFSINYAHITSSIYVIDKIVNRRKIQEVYMFLALSVDVIKDMIIHGKNDNTISSLLMVRHCSPNSVSGKYRQIASVNSAPFMKQDQEGRGRNNTMASSSIGLKEGSNRFKEFQLKGTPLVDKDKETIMKENANFQKKYGDDQDSIFLDGNADTSLSEISMIQEMKGLQRPNPEPSDGGGQILAMLSGTVFNPREYPEKEEATTEQVMKNKSEYQKPVMSSKQFRKSDKCQKCQIYITKIENLENQLQQRQNISQLAEYFQEENQTLKESLAKLQREAKMHRNKDISSRENMLVMEKAQLESQIRKLNQTVQEAQNREKEYQIVYNKYDEAVKIANIYETQIKTLEMQLEESYGIAKELKQKLDSQSMISSGNKPSTRESTLSTQASVSDSKVIGILKQNVKEKNVQIEELTKRNKLLTYQLQDMSRSRKSESGNLQKSVSSDTSERDRQNFVKKLNEISKLLMNEQGQKLRLSEQNFALRQLLKDNDIQIII